MARFDTGGGGGGGFSGGSDTADDEERDNDDSGSGSSSSGEGVSSSGGNSLDPSDFYTPRRRSSGGGGGASSSSSSSGSSNDTPTDSSGPRAVRSTTPDPEPKKNTPSSETSSGGSNETNSNGTKSKDSPTDSSGPTAVPSTSPEPVPQPDEESGGSSGEAAKSKDSPIDTSGPKATPSTAPQDSPDASSQNTSSAGGEGTSGSSSSQSDEDIIQTANKASNGAVGGSSDSGGAAGGAGSEQPPLVAKDPDTLNKAVKDTADRFADEQAQAAEEASDRRKRAQNKAEQIARNFGEEPTQTAADADTLNKAVKDANEKFKRENDLAGNSQSDKDDINFSALGVGGVTLADAAEEANAAVTGQRVELDTSNGKDPLEEGLQQIGQDLSQAGRDFAAKNPTIEDADSTLGRGLNNAQSALFSAPGETISGLTETTETAVSVTENSFKAVDPSPVAAGEIGQNERQKQASQQLRQRERNLANSVVETKNRIKEDPAEAGKLFPAVAAAAVGSPSAVRRLGLSDGPSTSRTSAASETARSLADARTPDIPDRTPEVEVRNDPNSGPIDIDPLLKEQVREAVRGSGPSARELANKPRQSVQAARERAGDVSLPESPSAREVGRASRRLEAEVRSRVPDRPEGPSLPTTPSARDLGRRSKQAEINARLNAQVAVENTRLAARDAAPSLPEYDGPGARELGRRSKQAELNARVNAQVAVDNTRLAAQNAAPSLPEYDGPGARELGRRSKQAEVNAQLQAQATISKARGRVPDVSRPTLDFDRPDLPDARELGRKSKRAEIRAQFEAESAAASAKERARNLRPEFGGKRRKLRDTTLRIGPIRPPRNDQVLSDLDVQRGGDASDDMLGPFADDSVGGGSPLDASPSDDVSVDSDATVDVSGQSQNGQVALSQVRRSRGSSPVDAEIDAPTRARPSGTSGALFGLGVAASNPAAGLGDISETAANRLSGASSDLGAEGATGLRDVIGTQNTPTNIVGPDTDVTPRVGQSSSGELSLGLTSGQNTDQTPVLADPDPDSPSRRRRRFAFDDNGGGDDAFQSAFGGDEQRFNFGRRELL